MNTRFIGYTLLILSLLIVVIVAYKNSTKSQVPIVFSESELLSNTWRHYKNAYLEATTGRTLDKQQNNITTSEGESYTLLRAVWMADKETFDQSYSWTKNNLARKDDSLFSWLFGEENGKYTVLTSQGGNNTASDADTDIALALIFAYGRWHDNQYLIDAKKLISDIWTHEVIIIKGKPYLLANNVEKISPTNSAIINPSYLSPYAYKIFAKIDPDHPWQQLADTSYEVLTTSLDLPLDKQQSVKLPPDWVVINKQTGEISYSNVEHLTTNYSYDALRTPWRIALDYEWFNDPRDKNLLDKMSFLTSTWKQYLILDSTYTHDGIIVTHDEVPAMYGGSIGYFKISDPSTAQQVYENKLKILYDPDKKSWKKPLSYYDENWVWFGLALYYNSLPNLASDITQEEIQNAVGINY